LSLGPSKVKTVKNKSAVREADASEKDSLIVSAPHLLMFVGWLSFAVFGFALLEGLTSVAFRDIGSGITAATLFAYGCSLVFARSQERRGQRSIALGVVCSGFLLATLAVVLAQPSLLPVLTLAPLLAVGVALPYATERTLRLLFVAAWLVTLAAAILAEAVSPETALPTWYESGLRVASLATAVAVVLLLLWQYRSRLVGALAQTRRSEQRAMHDATHDPLTGLPNRVLFLERLRGTLERARKDKGYLFAVLFLDLDRFKNVNDSLGHATGDLLLFEIARRLNTCVHPTDTVSRLGGDEFTVLLEDIEETGDAEKVAERIQEKLRTPFVFDGQEVYATASVGIVSSPADYRRAEDLLRDADTAMYQAKERGKARHEVFSQEMRHRAVKLLRLETDLRRAVGRGEFVVHYQPIVSLESGELVAFEALARWEHPERGLTSPEEFVPLAEETELIVPIGLAVLREACLKMSVWRSRFPERRPIGISVNLSPTQLARPELTEQISRVLRETGLSGRHLRLEVTESAIMRDAELAVKALSELRGFGIRMHVDDFGTGYSSLGLLHRFSVDALKIDRSFVSGMEAIPENAQIVQGITTLAHSLGLDVIAEGVDAPEQVELLRRMGCDYAQGYVFSKPVDAETAEAIIDSGVRW